MFIVIFCVSGLQPAKGNAIKLSLIELPASSVAVGVYVVVNAESFENVPAPPVHTSLGAWVTVPLRLMLVTVEQTVWPEADTVGGGFTTIVWVAELVQPWHLCRYI